MTAEDDEQNPFTRPGFLTAAILVALVVVLGIVIAIVNATSDDPDPTPTPSATTASTPAPTQPTTDTDAASVCGLGGEELSGTLTTAPDATWEYQGTTAYPTSEEYGPGATAGDGSRTCFQHSPAGALFMAANAIAQGSADPVSTDWWTQVLAQGPYRDQLLAATGSSSSTTGTRLRVAGFRLLHYDGDSARVDLGVVGSTSGQTITTSGVYELVWEDGDWKLSTDSATPLDVALIPDLAGYTAWGE